MDISRRIIPDLRKKLRLLCDHHHFADLSAISYEIETKLKTLESWADSGSDLKTPGLVTRVGFERLVSIFEHTIRKNHEHVDIEAALRGNLDRLEDLLRPSRFADLNEVIEREAITDRTSIFTQEGRLSIVQKQTRQTEKADHVIKLDQAFRIVFATSATGKYLLALQQAGQDWGFVPTHYSSASNEILLPDLDEDGLPAFVTESVYLGASRFLAFQLPSPPPTEILQAMKTGIAPAQQQLQRILKWYLSHNTDQRRVFEAKIEFATR